MESNEKKIKKHILGNRKILYIWTSRSRIGGEDLLSNQHTYKAVYDTKKIHSHVVMRSMIFQQKFSSLSKSAISKIWL
jgi:hypothetical protein